MVQLSLDVGGGLHAPFALAPGAWVLPGFALPFEESLRLGIAEITARAPFRRLTTPGGLSMSVAMTNAGALGWVSDERGYRYEATDPTSGQAWPPLPSAFGSLARQAAEAAGFHGFTPDACLVNRYAIGARLTPHRDQDERDLSQPIVSVSLGIPAVFLFGGAGRSGPYRRVRLEHGDVVVWGGPSRLAHHGVLPVEAAEHPRWGDVRVNLTFRRAG